MVELREPDVDDTLQDVATEERAKLAGSRLWKLIRRYPLPVGALLLLAAALVLHLVGQETLAQAALLVIILLGGIPLAWETLNQLLRRELSVDLIAILAIGGSLLLGQYLAGAIVVLMLSGGEALEAFALRRARSSLAALAERAPHTAHIRHGDELVTVAADTLTIGAAVVVKPGELIPIDGVVTAGAASVSEADLTGEPLPVRKEAGALVLSGSVDLDGVLDVRATRPSAESHYAQIVRLVEAAQGQKAPIHRLADRYAVWFTALAGAMAAVAWAISGDSLFALAVLVVATPCPLILATPIAIMSGIDRAARRGIILKSGAAMEQLGEVDVAVFDKTGTLTLGMPQLVDIIVADEHSPADKQADAKAFLLQVTASVEQFSGHILARAVVEEARARGLPLLAVPEFHEIAGKGARGTVSVDDAICGVASRPTAVAIGNRTCMRLLDIALPPPLAAERERRSRDGQIGSFLALAGRVVALLIFADVPRPQLAELSPQLKEAGIAQVVLLTGDGPAVAEQVGKLAGVDRVIARCLPEDKVRVVAELQSSRHRALMVGDGVNDAPALALATVGVAMGTQGLTASAGVADAVLLSTDILRIPGAVRLGRHVMRVARQGIWIGIGLSILAMIFAAFGFIPPAAGAILQEGIDVVVILNALRAGRD
jgi:heavy metal translocating P-type ATPase